MTKKGVGILMLALATVMCCLALIVSATFALFSDSAKITNHLVAGNLDFTLTRTQLETTYLAADGTLAKETFNTEADFSNDTDKSIFGEALTVAPGCQAIADMKLTHNVGSETENASNVAFGYWLEFHVTTGAGTALAQQLKVTVTPTGDESTEVHLTEATTYIGSDSEPIAIVVVGGSAEFSVKVEFPDLDAEVNNAAMNQTVEFDMVVHAIQVKSAS